MSKICTNSDRLADRHAFLGAFTKFGVAVVTLVTCLSVCLTLFFHLRHEGTEGEQRYSYTLPLTSALDGVGGQRHASAALPTRNRTSKRLSGSQGRSGRVQKIMTPYRNSIPGPHNNNTYLLHGAETFLRS